MPLVQQRRHLCAATLAAAWSANQKLSMSETIAIEMAVEPAAAERRELYGLLAEFEEHEKLLEAAKQAFREGYRAMDAYSPFPIEGLAEALGFRPSNVPLFTLLGGMAGGLGGYFMQWYSMG